MLFTGFRRRRRWPQLLTSLLLVVCATALAHLVFSGHPSFGRLAGGTLGQFVSDGLCEWFSILGSAILLTTVSIVALIVGTRSALLRTAAWMGRGMMGAAERVGGALLFVLRAQKDRLAKQRAALAGSRLEEAAFLAQLEADEEARAEEEREAAEAEAVAEEAVRLTKASEARPGPGIAAADPAWATGAASERRVPQIISSPPPSTALTSDPSTETLPPVAIGPMLAAWVAQAEGKLAGAASQPAAVAKMPLIVLPKAPPKPDAKRKLQEQFEFVGDRKSFTPPPLDVLESGKSERSALDNEVFLSTAEKLRAKLADFGITGDVVEIRPGPVVTMYEFLPGPGIKLSKIASLADDLAMAMQAMRVRIVAPIPGKGVVGIEVPNKDRETVYLREIAEQDAFLKSPSKLTMCLGKDIEGMPYVLDLARAPHLLIAGTTGSGKSVAVNAMIMSILLKSTPEDVRFIMVDPKMLELSAYEGIPHLLLPVVTDPKKAALALRWTVDEMERRYQLLSEIGTRNIAGYNKLVENAHKETKATQETPPAARKLLIVDVADGESEDEALDRTRAKEPLPVMPAPAAAGDSPPADSESMGASANPRELKKLPYIVLIIDELADLMMVAPREVETYIARLAQMARAAGIHLLAATQRPSTDVVTGVIKANFPTRISFMLRSRPDSMTILGTSGAEALLGMGDMLLMPPTSAHLQRVHGAYVSETEIKRAVDHLKAQGKPVYDDSILKPRDEDLELLEEDQLSDELYDQAVAAVSEMRQVSISMLQRKMRIGYNRAARMIERMERDGLVGPADGAKPRDVLVRPLGDMPGAGAL